VLPKLTGLLGLGFLFHHVVVFSVPVDYQYSGDGVFSLLSDHVFFIIFVYYITNKQAVRYFLEYFLSGNFICIFLLQPNFK